MLHVVPHDDMTSLYPRPLKREVQPDGSTLIAGLNLRLRVAQLRPGVLLVTARGEAIDADDVNVETELLKEFEAELQRAGELTLFADLRESPRMPAVSRERYTLWTQSHRDRKLQAHVLVRSALLEMALSVISLLIGGDRVQITTHLPGFLKRLQQVVPELTELPAAPA